MRARARDSDTGQVAHEKRVEKWRGAGRPRHALRLRFLVLTRFALLSFLFIFFYYLFI